MKNNLGIKILVELLWWVATALLTYIVVHPLFDVFDFNHFITGNVIYIAVAVTMTRYIFFLKHTWLAWLVPVKIVLIFCCVPLAFHLIERLQEFQQFADQEGLAGFNAYFLRDVNPDEHRRIFQYFRNEFVFFGSVAIISTIIFPVRLLISIWRNYNEGTV